MSLSLSLSHKYIVLKIPNLRSEAVLVSLGVLVRRVIRESGLLGRGLEILSADFADDVLCRCVLFTKTKYVSLLIGPEICHMSFFSMHQSCWSFGVD